MRYTKGLVNEFTVENIKVYIYESFEEMGKSAAFDASAELVRLQKEQDEINVMFAAAASQISLLDALCASNEIHFSKVNAFHMDEYAGLSGKDPRSLAYYLTSRHLDRLQLRYTFFIDAECTDTEAVCLEYEQVLKAHPLDIAFLGIGDNGHIAFNEPHIADFQDPRWVKTVEIDDVSKQQQVNAGNFPAMKDVPSLAYTVTIPPLMSAKRVFCTVPGKAKAGATCNALTAEISEQCPASILRRHSNISLYLDRDSASKLTPLIEN